MYHGRTRGICLLQLISVFVAGSTRTLRFRRGWRHVRFRVRSKTLSLACSLANPCHCWRVKSIFDTQAGSFGWPGIRATFPVNVPVERFSLERTRFLLSRTRSDHARVSVFFFFSLFFFLSCGERVKYVKNNARVRARVRTRIFRSGRA